jgi:hypothetical protein
VDQKHGRLTKKKQGQTKLNWTIGEELVGCLGLKRVRNDVMRTVEMEGLPVETTEYQRLIWYQHLQRMVESVWP